MEGIIYLGIVFVLPIYLAYRVALGRNRTTWKAILVTVFAGWVGLFCIWAFLKTRDKKTGFLK
jgi:hypothetical protein